MSQAGRTSYSRKYYNINNKAKMIYLCFDVLLFFNICPSRLQNMQNIHSLIYILYLEDAYSQFNIVYFDIISNWYHRLLIAIICINSRLSILSQCLKLFYYCLILCGFLVIYYLKEKLEGNSKHTDKFARRSDKYEKYKGAMNYFKVKEFLSFFFG